MRAGPQRTVEEHIAVDIVVPAGDPVQRLRRFESDHDGGWGELLLGLSPEKNGVAQSAWTCRAGWTVPSWTRRQHSRAT
jgi:hypothetical protein